MIHFSLQKPVFNAMIFVDAESLGVGQGPKYELVSYNSGNTEALSAKVFHHRLQW